MADPGTPSVRREPLTWLTLRVGVAIVVAAGTIAGWNALFAWDQDRTHGGPYEFWQGALMVLAVGVLSVGAGRAGFPMVATIVIPLALGWAAFQDWSRTDTSGLFFVGVLMLTTGGFAGVAPTAWLAYLFGPRRRTPVA